MRGVVIALLVLAAGLPLDAAGAGSAHARLVIADDPVVVHGVGFRSHERVRVTLRAGGTFIRILRATTRGTFAAAFPDVVTDRCSGYAASAVGNLGSRATAKLALECPPPAPLDTLMPTDLVPRKP